MDESYVALKESFLPIEVWTGFSAFEEVLEMALEGVGDGQFSEAPPDEVDEDLVRRLVQEEFDRKTEAERSWPAETDCNRLTKAFEKLTSMGILAVENIAYTLTDGWAEWDDLIDSEWIPAGVFDQIRGGCFYHGQDLEGAIAGRPLCIAFSALEENREKEEPIVGKQICEVLAEFGFKPEWNGDVSKRICVPIRWMRLYGPAADVSPATYVKPK
jgi:hypothetical protein